MAPSHSRHLLVWTAFPFAVLLSYLWFRKRRAAVPSDPGKKSERPDRPLPAAVQDEELEKLDESNRSFSRSDSAPIDIVLPPELRSTKSSQHIISDEDLDIEIEKIKSMKNSKAATPSKMAVSASTRTPANGPNEIKTPIKSGGTPKKVLKAPGKEANAPNKAGSKLLSAAPLSDLSTSKTAVGKKATKSSKKAVASPRKIEEDVAVELVGSPVEEKVVCKDVEKCEEAMSGHSEINRHSSERDSANHSPADVMLASPSLSSISDSHSEVSRSFLHLKVGLSSYDEYFST